MNTSTKVLIDKYAGKFIVTVARLIFSIFPSRKKRTEPENIVICKFLGMGSIIQSTPMLLTLRRKFPRANIIYLSSSSNKSLLDEIKVIDKSIIINDTGLFSTIITSLSCIRFLLFNRIDLFIDLEMYSHFSKIFSIASNAGHKFGMTNDALKERNVYSYDIQMHEDRPVSETYLEMCSPFKPSEIIHELYSFQTESKVARELKDRLGIKGDYILINPNASDLRIERRWPKENFSKLIDQLTTEYPEKYITLIGALSENEYVKSVAAGSNRSPMIVNTCGKLSISELITLISESSLMITNDTGPMHLSFAMKKPTIALFGPASPLQFGNHKQSIVVYKKVVCSPCVHHFIKPPCNGDNICMKLIEVREVMGCVRKMTDPKGLKILHTNS